MTILHTVIFAWVEGTTDADISRFDADLHRLASMVPGLESFETGRDALLRDGQADFVIVARFATEDALWQYLGHPAHEKVLGYARAMVARKESVQTVLT